MDFNAWTWHKRKEAKSRLFRSEDAVVVLAHMDYRDDLVDLLWQSIRARVGKSKPIQILAGHSHIRGYRPGSSGWFWLDSCMKVASQSAETGVAKDQSAEK